MALIFGWFAGDWLMIMTETLGGSPADTASKQGPMEAVQKSVRLFEEKRVPRDEEEEHHRPSVRHPQIV